MELLLLHYPRCPLVDIRRHDANWHNPYQLAEYLGSDAGPVKKYTPAGNDIDSFIEPLLVLSGERQQVRMEEIPDIFWPVSGKWKMRGSSVLLVLIHAGSL